MTNKLAGYDAVTLRANGGHVPRNRHYMYNQGFDADHGLLSFGRNPYGDYSRGYQYGLDNQPIYAQQGPSAGDVVGGVGEGALQGAVAGSIIPGVGTAVGAVAGGILGGLKKLFG
jgi:hypothetical protein